MTVTQPQTEVVRVTRADAPDAAATVADAFFDDPLWSWVLPDAARRRPTLRRAFGVWIDRLWVDHATTWSTGAGRGVAIWTPPHHHHVPTGAQVRMVPAMVRTFGRRLPRALRLTTALERVHPEEPHWYLAVLATAPSAQGQGLGSRLLRHTLDRCDADGVAAYLEASSECSRTLYLRHGFADRGAPIRVGDAPPAFPMWRDPR